MMRMRMRRLSEVVEEEPVRGALLPVDSVGVRGTPQALRQCHYVLLAPFTLLPHLGSGWVSVRVLRLPLLVKAGEAEACLRLCLHRRRLQLRIAPWSRRDRPSSRIWRMLSTRWIRWVLLPFLENAIFLRYILHDLRVSSSRTKLLERRMDWLTRVQAMVPVGGRPP